MWCLLCIFPLLVGEFIPEDDEHFQVFLAFMDVVDTVCAPVLSKGDIAFLKWRIEDFLEKYSEIEGLHIKPKAHHMIHYSSQLYRFGPLINCGTLRFEGKHNYFKEIVASTKNRKNLYKTMAFRHQYLQAYYAEGNNLFSTDLVSTNGENVDVEHLDLNIQCLLSDLSPNQTIYSVRSIQRGVKYCLGLCVVVGYEDDQYVFGKIENIFFVAGTEHLLLKLMNVKEFNRHFHAYEVCASDTRILYKPSQLLDYYPLAIYQVKDNFFVSLKYKVNHDFCA